MPPSPAHGRRASTPSRSGPVTETKPSGLPAQGTRIGARIRRPSTRSWRTDAVWGGPPGGGPCLIGALRAATGQPARLPYGSPRQATARAVRAGLRPGRAPADLPRLRLPGRPNEDQRQPPPTRPQAPCWHVAPVVPGASSVPPPPLEQWPVRGRLQGPLRFLPCTRPLSHGPPPRSRRGNSAKQIHHYTEEAST